ncbi:unnamed protein product, partial [Mesorhabditis spiculigera]
MLPSEFSAFFFLLPVLASAQDGAADSFSCYYCVHSQRKTDVETGSDQDPDCMNKLKFGSRTDLQRVCTSTEKYCRSTVTNLNGFFTFVERDCAQACAEGCEERGYGLFTQECTRCCQGHLCNEYDGRSYYLPNHGGWITSISGLLQLLTFLVCLS